MVCVRVCEKECHEEEIEGLERSEQTLPLGPDRICSRSESLLGLRPSLRKWLLFPSAVTTPKSSQSPDESGFTVFSILVARGLWGRCLPSLDHSALGNGCFVINSSTLPCDEGTLWRIRLSIVKSKQKYSESLLTQSLVSMINRTIKLLV